MWWFNLRPSNTEPLLRLNAEAADAATMSGCATRCSGSCAPDALSPSRRHAPGAAAGEVDVPLRTYALPHSLGQRIRLRKGTVPAAGDSPSRGREGQSLPAAERDSPPRAAVTTCDGVGAGTGRVLRWAVIEDGD